jgi:glycolate oxidase
MLDELRSIVGPDHVRTDVDTIRENSTDATRIFHPADAIVFPDTTAEVAAIVRLANRDRIPIVSRGGGVGFAGGAVPVRGGVVVSMRRMNRILEIHPIDLVAVVESGVITEDLHKAAEARGLFYPPDPASLKQSTIGGNVAHNAGGPRAFKYGVTRQYLMGLEAVLANGDVVRTGGRVVKNAVGYDLTNLLCGSEGTLGIITKLTMRLLPKPAASASIMALFKSIRRCAAAANQLIEAGIIPSKLELLDGQSLAAIRQYLRDEKIRTAVALPESAAALLLIEVDGDHLSVETSLQSVKRVVSAAGAEIRQADNPDDLWEIRRYMSPAVGRLRPNKINEDIVVPRSRVGDYLAAMERLQTASGLMIVCFGHVGDGNIHVNLMADLSTEAEREAAQSVKARIFQIAVELGGTISGEHVIGIM